MSLRAHAEIELDLIGMTADSTDEMNRSMRAHILHMVDEFAKEGHSGFSASYALGILTRLLDYKPLAPLTGEDSEWNEINDDRTNNLVLFQNKRCSRVFKNNEGAWDIVGKVYVDPNGSAYTGNDSHTPVTFPYRPTTEEVNVDENGVAV